VVNTNFADFRWPLEREGKGKEKRSEGCGMEKEDLWGVGGRGGMCP